jgi:hypothetical protein
VIILLVALYGCNAGDDGPGSSTSSDSTSSPPTPTDPTGETATDTDTDTVSDTDETTDGTVPFVEVAPTLKDELHGHLYEQIQWVGDATGVPTHATTPWVFMQVDSTAADRNYFDSTSGVEACWRSVPQFTLPGTRGLGSSVDLAVGGDTLQLRKSMQFIPGEISYVYSPDREDLLDGTTPGAELVLAGHPTGVEVPPPIEWEAGSWTELLATGTFEPRWTPSSTGGMIEVELQVFDSSYNEEAFFCSLHDDGHAIIPTGWDPANFAAVQLTFARVHDNVVQHPDLGTMYVKSFQNIALLYWPDNPLKNP